MKRSLKNFCLVDGGSVTLANIPRRDFRKGGTVRGSGTETSDSIPARLSKNEFVMPADSTRAIGADNLESLRQMTHGAGFASGGLAGAVEDFGRTTGDYWSNSNKQFEATNPGAGARVVRALNPVTGLGSALGNMHDAAGEGNIPGMVGAAVQSIPALKYARGATTAAQAANMTPGLLKAGATGAGLAANAMKPVPDFLPGYAGGGMVDTATRGLRAYITGSNQPGHDQLDNAGAAPAPAPAGPAWNPMAPSGDASRRTSANPAGIRFAAGGLVDDDEVPPPKANAFGDAAARANNPAAGYQSAPSTVSPVNDPALPKPGMPPPTGYVPPARMQAVEAMPKSNAYGDAAAAMSNPGQTTLAQPFATPSSPPPSPTTPPATTPPAPPAVGGKLPATLPDVTNNLPQDPNARVGATTQPGEGTVTPPQPVAPPAPAGGSPNIGSPSTSDLVKPAPPPGAPTTWLDSLRAAFTPSNVGAFAGTGGAGMPPTPPAPADAPTPSGSPNVGSPTATDLDKPVPVQTQTLTATPQPDANAPGGPNDTLRQLASISASNRDLESRQTGPSMSVVDSGADARQKFFDEANLRNAAAKGSWSPRKGYQSDENAIQAATIPIAARAKRESDAAQNATTLAGERIRDLTARRGQDVTERGQQLTAQTAYAKAAQEQFNANRTFGLEVQKQANETDAQYAKRREESAKAVTDRIAGMLPPGPDGKPDTAAAARYATALNAHVANRKAQLQGELAKHPDNAGAKNELNALNTKGHEALGEDAIRNFIVGAQANEVANKNVSWRLNPVGVSGAQTTAPITSLRVGTGSDRGLFGNNYIDNFGRTIPGRYLEAGGRLNPDYLPLLQQGG